MWFFLQRGGRRKSRKDDDEEDKDDKEEKCGSGIQETGEAPEDPDFIYSMKHGFVAVIVNTRFPKIAESLRKACEKDCELLRSFFSENLQFVFRVYENLSAEEMHEKFTDISEKDFSKYDSFFLFILGLENEGGLMGIDGQNLSVDSLTARFTNENCPSLVNKPRIFVIQAFGQDNKESATCSSDSAVNTSTAIRNSPILDDFLIVYSNPLSCVLEENSENGSYFIQTFIDVLIGYHDKEHFLDLLLRANSRIAKQRNIRKDNLIVTPRQESRWNKRCYFYPKSPA